MLVRFTWLLSYLRPSRRLFDQDDPAEPARSNASDTAKHSREVDQVLKPGCAGDIEDPHMRLPQVVSCHLEAYFIDQFAVRDAVDSQGSCHCSHRGVH